MKKLFISCPMRGLSDETIRKYREKLHKYAELFFEQELEVIDSIIAEDAPENDRQAVWYLGHSILKLAEADYFVGIQYSDAYPGCNSETRIARDYGIPFALVDLYAFLPEAAEQEIEFDERPALYGWGEAIMEAENE